MENEGHYIDDPMTVGNVKPDFSGLGLDAVKPYGMPVTLKDIIGDTPEWIKFLPDDFKGATKRAYIKFAVSDVAIRNATFDLKGFTSAKFILSLKHIMENYGMTEIRLTNNFLAVVDAVSNKEVTFFRFHIEYAKQ